MTDETVHVEFKVAPGKRDMFLEALAKWSDSDHNHLGYRADDHIQRRSALQSFVDAMETKLRKNDHKTGWRDQPIEAHIRFLMLEFEEFKVALEFLKVKDARAETVDVANFAMILNDKLGMLDAERNFKEQNHERRPFITQTFPA